MRRQLNIKVFVLLLDCKTVITDWVRLELDHHTVWTLSYGGCWLHYGQEGWSCWSLGTDAGSSGSRGDSQCCSLCLHDFEHAALHSESFPLSFLSWLLAPLQDRHWDHLRARPALCVLAQGIWHTQQHVILWELGCFLDCTIYETGSSWKRGLAEEELILVFFSHQGWVYLCSSGCPGTISIDKAGPELRNLPVLLSSSWD